MMNTKIFSEEEIAILGDDLFQVSHLLEAEMMAGNEIEILKKGFLHSRPTMLANHQMIGDVDENGIVKLEDGKKTIAPYKRAIVGKNEVAVKTPINSTGPHAITYTIPSYQFFEMTGYVEFPSVSISGSSAQGTINSRPYMMFGAYQTVYPYGGCDAGLVYYQEYGGWKLFINTGGQAGWHESSKVMTQKTVYLDMKFISGGVNLIVRDPNTWGIIEELTAYINPQFNTTPNNIELTREVALAQFVRSDNGDWLREAHWSQVYAYSKRPNLSAVKITAEYLQSSHSQRYTYSSSLTRFLIGDVAEEIPYISITPISNYHEEKISINL